MLSSYLLSSVLLYFPISALALMFYYLASFECFISHSGFHIGVYNIVSIFMKFLRSISYASNMILHF